MIRLTRDLYVAEEKILAASVHDNAVTVSYADGSPNGRSVAVPPFKDRDAAERWVADGFSDRPDDDFEEKPAFDPRGDRDLDVPVTVGHPVTADQVRERNDGVDSETAAKIAAAAGVPAGMAPALTPELQEIRERELQEAEEIQRNATQVVAEERITDPMVIEPRIPSGMTGSDLTDANGDALSSTGGGLVEDKVGPSTATIAPVAVDDPDGSRFNAEIAELAKANERDEARDDEGNFGSSEKAFGTSDSATGTTTPDFTSTVNTSTDATVTGSSVNETYPAPDAGADMPSPEPVAYGDTPVTDPTPEPVADPVEPVTDPTPVVDPAATPHEVTPMESAAQPGYAGIVTEEPHAPDSSPDTPDVRPADERRDVDPA